MTDPIPLHPLAELSRDREQVIQETVARTVQSVPATKLESLINDSIYWERKRLESKGDPGRDAADNVFWNEISNAIRKAESSKDDWMRSLLERICTHHAKEIVGNFDESVYRLATIMVPRGFGWLLQAASWKSFRNLFTENVDLKRKVHLQGKIDQLRKLSRKGTVILVPTHFSNIDSVLAGWSLFELGLPPFCYGAGLNLFTNPALGYFMSNLGAYKVDRRKRHEIYKEELKHFSTYILERGCHSLFFPGGGRSRSGGLEKKLKLGLLGTSIDAYVNNLLSGKSNPNIYVVPCVTSYHFVLEASTLIDDFLSEQGKSRYIIEDDESSRPKVIAQFLYKFFRASSTIYMNFGNALDPFGNLVDDEGNSIGPSGNTLDLPSFVRSGGQVCHVPQRDHEYTKHLGERIVSRYRVENIALTSHFIAYAYFEYLRQKFSPGDLFRLFRMDPSDTKVSLSDFASFCAPLLSQLHKKYEDGQIQLEPALRSSEFRNIFESAQRNLGVFHTKRPLIVIHESRGDAIQCEDLKLLFYYHNRMEGYGLHARES